MIASLPMYWRPENAAAWRNLWTRVRAACEIALPELTAPDELPKDLTQHWRDPALALSMACGFPFRDVLRDRVVYFGTFTFDISDAPGYYHSVVVVSRSMPGTSPLRLAVNSTDSQSGWACIRSKHPDNPIFDIKQTVLTGSHAGSLAAVADGSADIAYLDAVSWQLLKRFDPNARNVRAIGRTTATPGLPLIAAIGSDPAPLRAALLQAVAGLDRTVRAELGGLSGFEVLEVAAYLAVPDLPPEMPATS